MAQALTGANVLRLIRDKEANDVDALLRCFSGTHPSIDRFELDQKIRNLQDAGLIQTAPR